MQFKVDENLPIEAAELLANVGQDARTIYDKQMARTVDPRASSVHQAAQPTVVTLGLNGELFHFVPNGYQQF